MAKSNETKNQARRNPRKDYGLYSIEDIKIEEGFNPRIDYGDIEELARDIEQNGILVPLRGFKRKGDDKYTLIDGHRRFKAAKIVQKRNPDLELRIPIIGQKKVSEEERLFNVLSFNSGLPLNPLEESDVITRLVNFGLTDKEIVKRTGMTSVYISNLKLLSDAPTKIKNLVKDNVVSSTLAMKVLRENKDYNKAVEIMENAVIYSQSKGKSKVVQRDLDKSQDKVNSVSAVRKCFKIGRKEERVLRKDKKELYEFTDKILNGEFTKEQLEEFFFEPIK